LGKEPGRATARPALPFQGIIPTDAGINFRQRLY
jgi:hypothetical protein